MRSQSASYHGYRFLPDIISHAVWLYHRFCLSFRDAEDLLAQRGVTVTYETIRQWCQRFGPVYARRLRRRHARVNAGGSLEPAPLSRVASSATKLRELQERDLSGEDVVALVLDGKTFAEATMVVALGITMTGDKRFLGFVETDTENEQVLTPFLRSLVERGLDVSQGLLVIVDGGKGLRAAVRKAFRHRALVQRCQWHTRENVVSYVAKREQPVWRQRLQRAYNRPEYDEALAAPPVAPA